MPGEGVGLLLIPHAAAATAAASASVQLIGIQSREGSMGVSVTRTGRGSRCLSPAMLNLHCWLGIDWRTSKRDRHTVTDRICVLIKGLCCCKGENPPPHLPPPPAEHLSRRRSDTSGWRAHWERLTLHSFVPELCVNLSFRKKGTDRPVLLGQKLCANLTAYANIGTRLFTIA
ncbi:hypothetical protein D4764_01G0019420 [Takifugu flavidus]|uniref:Secreted protein n=1 Tax=Takifugu flavidus TaxID=433684 RepID=A0A5C6PU47_9TELE|nr:hypothetical protein D4764_01G0019420 [Takifugu flavidus]